MVKYKLIVALKLKLFLNYEEHAVKQTNETVSQTNQYLTRWKLKHFFEDKRIIYLCLELVYFLSGKATPVPQMLLRLSRTPSFVLQRKQ